MIRLETHELRISRSKRKLLVLVLDLQVVLNVDVQPFLILLNCIWSDHHFEVGLLQRVAFLSRELQIEDSLAG